MQHHERRNLTRFEYEVFNQLESHQRLQKDALEWPRKVTSRAIMGAVTGIVAGLSLAGMIIVMVRIMVE